ncbi:MAG: Panacea domain-containing protein [Methanobacteriaceae archaeon]|nr:Panacea domain-containing protein [Methanobacteriaceae archaeon]
MNNTINYVPEKFKAMIHYIINKCESKDNFGRVVLYKLLYFSDFNNYEKYEESISGETYIRKSMGPVPIHFHEAIKSLINEDKITETSEKVIDFPKFKYNCLKKPNVELLSDKELNTIDDTINKISHLYSDEISKYSHGDLPWRLAKDGDELNYEAVFYREPEYSVRKYDD